MKKAAFDGTHIGHDVLINRHLEQMFYKLNNMISQGKASGGKLNELKQRILTLMTSNKMSFENYIKISNEFLIGINFLGPNNLNVLNAEYTIEVVRKAISESGQIILALHLNDGIFSPLEMNIFWTNGILPLGIPSKHYEVDLQLRSPLAFLQHDLAHAMARIHKLKRSGDANRIAEKTRVLYSRILNLDLSIGKRSVYLQELVVLHLHESGSNELLSTHDFITSYLLPSVGQLAFSESLVSGLKQQDAAAKLLVLKAARKLLKDHFRAFDFYKDHQLRKATADDLAAVLEAVLILEPN